MRNLVAALFRLEKSRTQQDVQQVLALLVDWLRAPVYEGLRRAFAVWLRRVLLPARLPAMSLPEVQDLVEVQSMLAERVIEWTQEWKEQGRREARRVERRAALAAERALLRRMTQKRFGDTCAQALAPLLAKRRTPEALEEVGEWIVTYDTGEAFLARVQAR